MLLLYHVDVDGDNGIGGKGSTAAELVVAARVIAIPATSPGRDNTDRRIFATWARRPRPGSDTNARLVSSMLFKNLISTATGKTISVNKLDYVSFLGSRTKPNT